MSCDPYLSRPILNGLPPVFKVNIRTDRSGQWLESSILHLVEEAVSGRVGSEAMLAKLSEALFVDTLRRCVAGLPEQQRGWLTGARDPIVGRSLGLMHRRIAHPWTIASLADEVGISRSALVERFTRYLSEPPMAYLTRWRLQLAARSLERTSRGVAEIAGDVGYESEAAFNRAFKREFGRPPGRYRSDHKECLVTRPRNGRGQDERAVSSTISAVPILTTKKRRRPSPGQESALRTAAANARPAPRSTSPQCQPTTDSQENNLDPIEHTLYTCHVDCTAPVLGLSG